MGLLTSTADKEARYARGIAKAAREAAEAGRRVFAPMLNPPPTSLLEQGNRWGEMVESIENEGWTLTHWAVGASNSGAGDSTAAYPVFRRS